MKLGEIIQRVQSLYSKGVQSDDSRLTPRHIYNKLLTLRAKYIAQQAKKKQKLNQWNFQRLDCVELIKVPQSMCPCQPVPGCEILRTKYELPKPLSDLNRHLIESVTSLDGSIIFSEINWKDLKYKAHSKYTSKKPDYFIDSGYLYIVGLTQSMRHLKTITITGLFEDPVAADSFFNMCNCNNSLVDTVEENIPYEVETAEEVERPVVVAETIEVEVREKAKIEEDTHFIFFYDVSSMGDMTVATVKRNLIRWYASFRPTDIIYDDNNNPIILSNLDFTPDNVVMQENYGVTEYLKHILDGRENWLGMPVRLLPQDVINEISDSLLYSFTSSVGDYRDKNVMTIIFVDEATDFHNSMPLSNMGVMGDDKMRNYEYNYKGFLKAYPYFKSFVGLNYPMVRGYKYIYADGTVNYTYDSECASFLQHIIFATNGYDFKQEEAEAIVKSLDNRGINEADMETIKSSIITKINPYKTLLDKDGYSGLKHLGWTYRSDKNCWETAQYSPDGSVSIFIDPEESSIPTPQQFSQDIEEALLSIRKESIIKEEQTFFWTYPQQNFDIIPKVKQYKYPKEIWDCCGPSKTITDNIYIDIPKYTVKPIEVKKTHKIEYTEAYWGKDEFGKDVVLEREAEKTVLYTEEQNVLEEDVETLVKSIQIEVCDEPCTSPLDNEFPIENEYLDPIISEAAEELVTFFGGQKEDLTNDTKDNIAEESK